MAIVSKKQIHQAKPQVVVITWETKHKTNASVSIDALRFTISRRGNGYDIYHGGEPIASLSTPASCVRFMQDLCAKL